jgi:hypothetical protein
MPRPRKPDPDRKSTRLAVRLTPAERLQIEQAALEAGVSASAYLRIQVLNGRIDVYRHRAVSPALFDQIRRIGVNLNQLTRLAHETGKMPAGLSRVCKSIEEIVVREVEADAPKRDSAWDSSDSAPFDTGEEEMLDAVPDDEPD